MRCGRRPTSILTVHFKRQSSSSSSLTQTANSLPPPWIDSENPGRAISFCFSLLKLSAKVGHACDVDQVHGYAIKLGICSSLSLQNQVLDAYVKRRDFDDADKLFDGMPERNVVAWNIMIHGVVHRGGHMKQRINLGFGYLRRMLSSMVDLDYVSVLGLMRLCTEFSDVEAGSQLHCLITKHGLGSGCCLSTSLVDFYGKCGFVTEARRVFNEISDRDLVLWNTLISSYVLNGMIDEAISILKLMRLRTEFRGDGYTFSNILGSCGSVQGKQIHGYVLKLSLESDIPVATSLINMYAKSSQMRDARKCFESMVARNVVTWNSMIVGYGKTGDGREAMRILVKMLRENVHPDEYSFASILSSCAKISAVREIFQMQSFITKKGFGAFPSVANSMINAYSRTGNISEALVCFHSLLEPDLVSWTSIIGALAFHGFSKESLIMFERMRRKLQPDKITFLEVMSACSHGGLVQEGLRYFEQMMSDVYKIEPESEHYACLVDLLSRAGFIDDAYKVLMAMPMEPSSHALAAFSGACNVHGNRESMKWAAKKLVELEPSNPANYSMLSNIYMSEGHWMKAAHLRKTVKKVSNSKIPGCSWVGE
ncbi:PREDICTED: pentatricopeptide repeat-containing protein At2g46050, mitochondrial [Tarenaya hassleriana]|uniref:pentatricopeptide repeat-containing protein At2g46050, mitochondrial n=1 Tax=Tarenaya hassleriana TaxID=28532 RepID=UPI00053C8F76|nr:PREDICTED: pentatricopeptide repeat-containing protein At2g46050, mitochondrial [Tarenaya hassleriana]XP_010544750.1 PREDICTED: pentatricopeptide repeat-containing protein At2g46050, mitochondrial [Tarenaya hassleriana]